MSKAMYGIISGDTTQAVMQGVTNAIAAGYEPLGGVCYGLMKQVKYTDPEGTGELVETVHEHMFHQAILKPAERILHS